MANQDFNDPLPTQTPIPYQGAGGLPTAPAQQPKAVTAPTPVPATTFTSDKDQALFKQLQAQQKAKTAEDEAAQANYAKNAQKWQDRAEHAFNAEALGPDDLPAWDADKELKKRSTSPMEAFGSFASVATIAAAAFTRMPLTNSLNASAAAMTAIHKNDTEAYNRAFDAFKENSNLFLKRHALMHQEFEDANKLIDMNMTEWRTQTDMIAQKYGDQKTLAYVNAGMDEKVFELQALRARAAVGLAEARDKLIEQNIKMSVLNADPRWKSGVPQKMKAALDDYNDDKLSPELQLWKKHKQENPDELSEDSLKFLGSLKQAEYGGRGMGPSYASVPQALESWTAVRGKPPTPEMQAIIEGAYSTKGASAPAKIAQVGAALEDIKSRLAKGETLSDDRQESILRDAVRQSPTATSAGIIDDATADVMAEQYLAGDKSVFTNLGRGGQGPQNIAKIRNAIGKKAKEQGLSGTDIALRLAEFNGLVSGERALGTQTARVEMFAGEAYRMMDVARKASADVPRGEWVPVNRALQAFETQTGDPKIVAFGAAINTLVNTYAKAIAGGGQATVSDKEHARGMLEFAFSEQQFDAVLNTLGQELEAARAAPGMVKQSFRNLAGEKNLQGNLAPEPNVIRYDAEGNRIQ